jgi:ATP-dependent Clp protease ATP-binding subunit ClpA
MEKVEGYFSPEFMNRITNTIIFNQLTIEDARIIFNLEYEKTKKRIKKLVIMLKLQIMQLSIF